MTAPAATVTGIAAPLIEDAIDTDVIFPARFLLLMNRAGLGRYLFHDRRFDPAGRPRPGFVLDEPRFRDARILLAGAAFGSGSSREQAVWTLADHGIGCVVAPSFGDIFAANCAGNGVIAAIVPADRVALLATAGGDLVVDLVAQTISAGDAIIGFDIDPRHRAMLLSGRDPIDRILEDCAAIADYDRRRAETTPWLTPHWAELAP